MCEKEVFDRLVATSHEFAQWCLSMAQCHLFIFEMKNRLIAGSAKERYVSFLKNRPEILNQVQLKVIASYLDVTPAVSVETAQNGALIRQLKHIAVSDPTSEKSTVGCAGLIACTPDGVFVDLRGFYWAGSSRITR